MKRKFIWSASLLLVFALVFLYTNHNYLSADNRDNKKKDCSSFSGCIENKSGGVKAGGEWSAYEFLTDRAYDDEMKTNLKAELMNTAGVKDVKFSHSCSVSKMTYVSVYYAADETTQETLESLVKDKGFDCSGSGCEDNKDCSPKNKKTDGRNI